MRVRVRMSVKVRMRVMSRGLTGSAVTAVSAFFSLVRFFVSGVGDFSGARLFAFFGGVRCGRGV